MSRIDTIRGLVAYAGASGAVITHLADIRWAVGFSGSHGILVVTPEAAHFVTDGRYDEQARAEVDGAEVHVPGYALWKHVAEAGLLADSEVVAFQSDHVTVDLRQRLGDRFRDVEWRPLASMLVEAVAAKAESEIAAVRNAQALTCEVMASIIPLLHPGVSERKIAAELVYRHLEGGAERMAFDPIVGSGPNGALPHARATARTLQSGDLVVIDVGCMLDGYASDLTRTFAIGEPGDEARSAYAAVLAAQEAGIKAARAGITGTAMDAAARDVLDARGFGDYFTHSLGHGVGLDVHEWPRLSKAVEHVLPEGATVTVEPGVYLPGRFGIRIEDVIAITADGHENLTPLAKDLLVL